MKVNSIQNQETQKLYQARENRAEKKEDNKNEEKQAGSVEKNTIYAGDLKVFDSIMDKKIKAQKESIKTLLEQFTRDGEIDGMIEESESNISRLNDENGEIKEQIAALDEEKKKLKEDMGISDDSQEQKDLELIEKRDKLLKEGKISELSEEEQQRLKDMGPLTEYQKMALSLDSAKKPYQDQIDKNNKQIEQEVGTVKGIKQALLGRKAEETMIGAKKEAEAILKNASEDIRGMLVKEAKDHIDETQKEEEEKAEEAQKEKEEQEEKIEKNDMAEQQIENGSDSAKKIKRAADKQENLEADIKELVEKQKLLEEDIKGVAVDTVI